MRTRWPLVLVVVVLLAAVACVPREETATPGSPDVAPESTQASDSQEATQVPGSPQPTPVTASLEPERPRVLYSRNQVEEEVEETISALPGDRIWTAEQGRALLKWPDVHLRLYDDTEMHVEDITPTWMRLAVDSGAALSGASPAIQQRIEWTTGDALITLTGTTVMVAYHPARQLTILRVFDGQSEIRNLTGEQQAAIVNVGEWSLVEPGQPPQVSDRLEEMRVLARELGLWDLFHEIELDVRDGFGPDDAQVPPEDVEIVFVQCTVVSQELSLRTGPGTVYAPPIGRLAQNTALTPLARSVDGGWIQVQVEHTGQKGWISADPQYVSCNIDLSGLETAAVPLPSPTPCVPQPPGDWQRYVVRSGDTLYSLATKGGTNVDAVMRVNCLTGTTIVRGQWLWLPCIPQPPADWQGYVVERGDTLYSLAEDHGTTVDEIKDVNCLVDNTIVAGQWLWLPPRSIPETFTIELKADADAYVWDEESDGAAAELRVCGDSELSFIHFDLTSIPAGATIEEGTLLLYLMSGSPYSSSVAVSQVMGDWDEYEIDWDTQPVTRTLVPAVSTPVNGSLGDYSWNVTALVRSWVGGTSANYGLRLHSEDRCSILTKEEKWVYLRYFFASREGSLKSANLTPEPPRLRIRYTVP